MRWTRQRWARRHVRRAVFRERSTACRRTALKRLRQNFGRPHKPVGWFGEGSCVRQKRVVLAPVAGVKSAEVFAKPNRVRKTVNSPAMEARGIRLQGERAISRQTIAQGRPDALRWTCMLVCALLCAHCTRDRGCSAHPVFPAPSLGESFGPASGASRREIANAYSVVIARLDVRTGRPSIPETAVIESIGRGVLDAPPARGMTVLGAATIRIASGIRGRK
jgi:hypothetical protein